MQFLLDVCIAIMSEESIVIMKTHVLNNLPFRKIGTDAILEEAYSASTTIKSLLPTIDPPPRYAPKAVDSYDPMKVKLPLVMVIWELTFGARRAAARARVQNFMMVIFLIGIVVHSHRMRQLRLDVNMIGLQSTKQQRMLFQTKNELL